MASSERPRTASAVVLTNPFSRMMASRTHGQSASGDNHRGTTPKWGEVRRCDLFAFLDGYFAAFSSMPALWPATSLRPFASASGADLGQSATILGCVSAARTRQRHGKGFGGIRLDEDIERLIGGWLDHNPACLKS